ncbi:hypothetical protein [Sphingomonas hylomeconis]|uniref:hypothetical protein n=1 Tax=Sphingomonas hylomeconis TaxID=1395958 RepID=UPI0021BA42EC|nr:hypothetical protein [Sphingomonas hylomeconis]
MADEPLGSHQAAAMAPKCAASRASMVVGMAVGIVLEIAFALSETSVGVGSLALIMRRFYQHGLQAKRT